MTDSLPRNQDSMAESDMKLQHSHYESKSSDDDLKQQAHVHMKQVKPSAQSAVSTDQAGSASMVSGLTGLISGSAQKVVDALPTKVADVLPTKLADALPSSVADVLPAKVAGALPASLGGKSGAADEQAKDDKDKDKADDSSADKKQEKSSAEQASAPIDSKAGDAKGRKQSARRDRGKKGAKGGAGLMAKASATASNVSQQASSAAAGVSNKASGLASGVSGTASGLASSITAIPSNISNSISGTVNSLKATIDHTLSGVQQRAVHLRDAALHNDIMDAYEDEGLQAAAKKAVVVGSKAAKKLKTKVLKSVSATASSISGSEAAPDKFKGRRRRGGRRRGNRKLKTKLIDVPQGETILDSLGERASEVKEVVIEEGRLSQAVHNAEAKAGGVIQSVKASASGLVHSIAAKIPVISSLAGGAAASSTDGGDQSEQADDSSKDDSSSSGSAGLTQKASVALDSAKTSLTSAVDSARAQLPELESVKRQAGQQLHAAKQVVAGNVEQVTRKLPGNQGKQKPRRKGNGDSKPTLDRRAELPSLGTPAAPESSTTELLSQKPLIVNSGGSGSTDADLGEKAKFMATAKMVDHTGAAKAEAAGKSPISAEQPSTNLSGSKETGTEFLSSSSGSGGLLEKAKSFVIDKVDQLAMNADDTEPMEEPSKAANSGVLAKAGKALQDMQDAVAEKLDDGNGDTSKQ